MMFFFVFFDVEQSNVEDRLKRVLAKFEANWSYPRGANGRSKFTIKLQFFFGRDKKMKRRESSETRFRQVSGQSESYVRGEQSFEVSD